MITTRWRRTSRGTRDAQDIHVTRDAHDARVAHGAHDVPTDTRVERAPKRILLIVDAFHPGETLRIMPYVLLVRERFPDAWITLLVNESTLSAFGHTKGFDDVVISRLYYDRPVSRFGALGSKLREVWRLLGRLGTGYDLVITYYWGSPLLQLLGYAVGRQGRRVAHSSINSPLLSCHLGRFDRHKPYPEQQIRLLRAAGIETTCTAPPAIRCTEDDASVAATLLRRHGLDDSRMLCVLHLGTDWPCQRWLPERWAALADVLATRHGMTVLFTGTSDEADLISDVQRRMRSASISLAGATTLAQLAALLARCRLCVCVDSSIFELTQAVGIPAVVLAGPSRPETIVPGASDPVVVRGMGPRMAAAANACQHLHASAWKNTQVYGNAFVSVRCVHTGCPFAGLRGIMVAHVLAAVNEQMRASAMVGSAGAFPSNPD